jgi:hypothetical protein
MSMYGLGFLTYSKGSFRSQQRGTKEYAQATKEMICEIKGRKKHCYGEGYNAVAQAYYFKDEK